jgi:molybdopterin-guanine dinucleotide biosynthesis protein A
MARQPAVSGDGPAAISTDVDPAGPLPAVREGALAVILAGGQSRRMGQHKAWLEVGGQPLIRRVWSACRAVPLPVCFQGEVPGLAAAFPDVPAWRDPVPGGGPLTALAEALARADGQVVLLLACDLPFLTPALLRGVLAALGEGDWAVPVAGGRDHPLCAAYAPSVLPRARALLAAGRRSLRDLLAAEDLHGRRLPLEPAWGDPESLLCNVNTPEDLAAARRRAAG